MENKEKKTIPFWEKLTLSIEEAALYSGIGQHKIRELTNSAKGISFTLRVGRKVLIKRVEFERFISKIPSI